MARIANTNVTAAKRITRDADFRDTFIPKLVFNVQNDAQSMDRWIKQKRDDYKRRYQANAERGTSFPWPGASSFEYPGSDIEIDELKPAIMNIHFGGRRIVDMVPMDMTATDNASRAGLAMEHLLKYRMSERGTPDYKRQTALSAESFLQHGISTDKVYYSYLTQASRQHFTRETIPDALKMVQVVDEIDQQQAQQILEETGVLTVARRDFGSIAERVEKIVVEVMNLDLEERADRVALDQFMAFIKANNIDQSMDVMLTDVIEDSPRIVNCELESIVVPPGTRRISQASRVRHDMWFTEDNLRMRANNNQWDQEAVDNVLANAKSKTRGAGAQDNSWIHDAMRTRTRTETAIGMDDERFKISEIYTYRLNAKKIPVPVVVTMELEMGEVLRAVDYNYAHGSWPFEETNYEINEDNYFASRGIPQKIKNLEKHMSGLVRAELNGLLMMTSQSFTYIRDSGINPQKMRWMPHLMIPVRRHEDLQPIATNSKPLALERPMAFMQNLITRTAGGRTLANEQAQRRDRGPTAAQVGDDALSHQAGLGLRGLFFQDGRSRLFRQAWSLWKQFGPEEFYAQVAGEQLEKMSQHQIRGEFQLVPAGAVADMDPQFRTQQAMQVLDIMMKAQAMVSQDARFKLDIPMAIKDVMDRLDPQASMRLMPERTPEEQKQFLEQQQQAAQQAAALADEAKKLQEGAATTPEGAMAVLRTIAAKTPHKNLQPIIDAGAQAEQAAQNSQQLSDQNQGNPG